MTARTVVPRPAGEETSSRPSSAAIRSLSPRRPGPVARVGAADPVVGDRHDEPPVLAAHVDRGVRRVRVARDVRDRLGDDEVRRGLDRRRQPLVRHGGDLDRQRHPLRQRLQRRPEPAIGEHRRMDPARELAQLADRLVEVLRRAVEQLPGRLRIVVHARARQPQAQRERDEPLLRAVVQVALDLAPRRVGALDDPRARGAQLGDGRAQLRRQPLVLQRQRGRAADGVHELGLLGQRRVVHEHRDRAPVALDGRAAVGSSGSVDRVRRARRPTRRAPAASRRARATGRAARRPARPAGRRRPRRAARPAR